MLFLGLVAPFLVYELLFYFYTNDRFVYFYVNLCFIYVLFTYIYIRVCYVRAGCLTALKYYVNSAVIRWTRNSFMLKCF